MRTLTLFLLLTISTGCTTTSSSPLENYKPIKKDWTEFKGPEDFSWHAVRKDDVIFLKLKNDVEISFVVKRVVYGHILGPEEKIAFSDIVYYKLWTPDRKKLEENSISPFSENLEHTGNNTSGWIFRIGVHSYGYIPWPIVDAGYNGRNIGFRYRIPALGVGRAGAEISLRNLISYNVHPYLSIGRNYYVVGFDSFYGVGIEYQFENTNKFMQIELSRVGLTPVESSTDYDPRYEITYGLVWRF